MISIYYFSKPTEIFEGQLFAAIASFILEIGVAKSGVKGPLIWGSKVSKLIIKAVHYRKTDVHTLSIE